VRGKTGLLGEQEREQPLELAIARAIPGSTHERYVLGPSSPIAYPRTHIFEMLEEERDPLPPRHGVGVTGSYPTPSAVEPGNMFGVSTAAGDAPRLDDGAPSREPASRSSGSPRRLKVVAV
jgi:hypothetical protein